MGVFYETGTTAAYDNYDHLEIEDEDITLLEVDLKEALYHYKLSAEMNYPLPCLILQLFTSLGWDVSQTLKKPKNGILRLHKAGYTAAIYKLGKMHAFGKGGLPVDEESYRTFFRSG